MKACKAPISVEKSTGDNRFLVAKDNELILSTNDATDAELNKIVEAVNGKHAANSFWQELLDSVETLTGVAYQHGTRTLADLMYLQMAILNNGYIDHYPGESKVLEIASALPSGDQWSMFIKVDHMLAPAQELQESSDTSNDVIGVPQAVLASLIDMANSHIEDIDSGIEDGTYLASENTDIEDKRKAAETANEIYRSAVLSALKPQ